MRGDVAALTLGALPAAALYLCAVEVTVPAVKFSRLDVFYGSSFELRTHMREYCGMIV